MFVVAPALIGKPMDVMLVMAGVIPDVHIVADQVSNK